MTRIACLMMQKDERLLLKPWLLYHGLLFGFENLYVFDNGSANEECLSILQGFEEVGVNVERKKNTISDFEHKGIVLGEKIKEFKLATQYDIVVPLDCDEFLAINGENGISCSREEILQEVNRINLLGIMCRTMKCLDNRPGYVDLFRYIGHVKSIVVVRHFEGIDHGFHQATIPPGTSYGPTSLVHIHMHFKPFAAVISGAENKLAPFVDVKDRVALKSFEGVGNHLKKYFFMNPSNYYADLNGYKDPLIRFTGLTRILSVMMSTDKFREEWEADRPTELYRSTLIIDLALSRFNRTQYLLANPDLREMKVDLFWHFITAGYKEGRSLTVSQNGYEDVVNRLADLRATIDDGVTGFVGLAIAMSKLGRGGEADAILTTAISRFGNKCALLKEFAFSALHQNNFVQAAERFERVRESFPSDPVGYHFGSIAYRLCGEFAEARAIADQGLLKFPEHIGMLIAKGDLLSIIDDAQQARIYWHDLEALHPGNAAIASRVALLG